MDKPHPTGEAPLLRTQIRIADLVCQVVRQARQARRLVPPPADGLASALERYRTLSRLAERARDRHWLAAAAKMLGQSEEILPQLRYETEVLCQPRHIHTPVRPGDVMRDLHQLQAEFGSWAFDRDTATLSVTTEPIELKEVHLGPFEIELRLRDMGRSDPARAFSIIAAEPNHPSGRDDITHPHVRDERLCPGDAAGTLHNALAAGRVCDAFLLVRSVLQDYNPHSAYVSLEAWHGYTCHDCGGRANEEDIHYCEACGHDFCDSCFGSCIHCEKTGCRMCLHTCDECDEMVCTDCLRQCPVCQHQCCPGCMEGDLCADCAHTQENPHETDIAAAA